MAESTKNPSLKASLSEDLTVVLLRGNGSPRTFRLSLPGLQRSLTALGFAFVLAVVGCVVLLFLNVFHFAPATVSAPPAAVPVSPSTGFWGGKAPEAGKGDEELRKEVAGLREDIAKLGATANGRKDLAVGANNGLLQFFGPRNVMETSSPMQVKNVKVVKSPGSREMFVDFELHNVDPEQRQARGYILVLAKTPGLLLSYPENAFNPSQNIVLDYTKGETFGVSRFRQARANFPAGPLEGKDPRFQVLLFSTDGKVIADLHVEE